MPLYLSVARKAAVALGIVCIAAALIFFATLPVRPEKKATDIRVGAVSLVLGIFLVVPHRRIFKTRVAPFWLGLSLLLPAIATVGLAVSFWPMFKGRAFDPMIAVSCAMWLFFCANGEYARRSFLLRTNEKLA